MNPFEIAKLVLAAALLLILWGWSQNGRWQFDRNTNATTALVVDTRTGDVHLAYQRVVRVGE